jgi:hypothetical protein
MERTSRPALWARLSWWALDLGILFWIYLLFVGEVSKVELLAAAIIAGLGFAAWLVVSAQPLMKLLGDPKPFLQGYRLVGYVFTDTWKVLLALFRQLAGGRPAESIFRAVPFADCGEGDRAATQRALAIAYSSATPNMIVLDVDLDAKRMLFHELVPSGVPEMTRRLGAGE